jgi:hypothetical protein
VTESIRTDTGFMATVRHRMMDYYRDLDDPKLVEYLLVSAVETNEGASVCLWLGIDIAASDLTVFAASDAPA